MVTDVRLVTADELLNMPDDGVRIELVEGEVRRMAPAGLEHGTVAGNVSGGLFHHVKTNDLGTVPVTDTGFKLRSNPDTVRAPDASFVSKARVEAAGTTYGYFPGAPDLAIGVLSPNDQAAEVERKVFEWLDAGTRLVIVFNPKQRTATTYRSRTRIHVHTEAEMIDAADVVPGW